MRRLHRRAAALRQRAGGACLWRCRARRGAAPQIWAAHRPGPADRQTYGASCARARRCCSDHRAGAAASPAAVGQGVQPVRPDRRPSGQDDRPAGRQACAGPASARAADARAGPPAARPDGARRLCPGGRSRPARPRRAADRRCPYQRRDRRRLRPGVAAWRSGGRASALLGAGGAGEDGRAD